jgi:uncharacterized protein involved in outer membrane biogenesis
VDLAKQQVVVGKIRSNKLETWAALEADGQLDWQKLFASQPSKPAAKAAAEPANTPAAADSPKAEPTAPSKPWQVLLKDVQLRDYTVHLADRSQTCGGTGYHPAECRYARLRQPQRFALQAQAR